MRQSRFTEEQIIGVLKQAEGGMKTVERKTAAVMKGDLDPNGKALGRNLGCVSIPYSSRSIN